MANPRTVFLVFLLLAVGTALPHLDNPFRNDDFVFLRAVQDESLGALLSPSPQFAFYRPGALLLFLLEYRLFGQIASLFIALNLAIHLGNATLARRLLERLGLTPGSAAVAAGLFAVGFLHYGKPIGWACTSGSLAAWMLVLVALVTLAGADRAPPKRRVTIAVSAAALAPAFHEIGMILPLLVIAAGARFTQKSWRMLAALSLPAVAWMTGRAIFGGPVYGDVFGRVPGAIVGVVRYAGLGMIPIQRSELFRLVPIGPDRLLAVARVAQVLLGSAFLIYAVGAAAKARDPSRTQARWSLLLLASISLVGMPPGWLDLRYLYFPSTAMIALLVLLCRRLPTTWQWITLLASTAQAVTLGLILALKV